MKITIFYFSGTGNTWWVVKKFSEISESRGHVVKYISLESDILMNSEKIKEILSHSDLMGIAYPIYGSTMPAIMWDFLEKLTNLVENYSINPPSQSFVLTSMMMFSGDGALVAGKKLKKMGIPLKYAKNIKMCSNISMPYFRLNPKDLEKMKDIKEKAEETIKKFILKMENQEKSLQGYYKPFGRFFGWLQRTFLEKSLDAYRPFKVDDDRCTKCNLCVNYCPTNNIDMKYEQINIRSNCIFCLRCYNFCPTHAIMPGGKYSDPDKYHRYHGPITNFKLKYAREDKM